MVGEERHLVVGHQVARDGFAVVWSKELGGCMPQLSSLIILNVVKGVLELDVALVDPVVELGAVFDRGEMKRLAGVEDSRMLCKVAIIGIVETICAA